MQIPEQDSSEAGCLSQAYKHLQVHWKILTYGQILSLFLASAGAAQATLHLDCAVSAPTFTMSMVYGIVATVHLFKLKSIQRLQQTEQRQYVQETNNVLVLDKDRFDFLNGCLHLQRPAWHYFVMAFLDVEANAVTMLAFRYTTLTSITLYDALAIPSAMLLSACFLARQYSWLHFVGVVVCMIGVVVNVLGDYESNQQDSENLSNATSAASGSTQEPYPNKLLGDVLAITGGFLYGLNDVIAEATVRRNGDTVEYLAMMGLFAFSISFVQAAILEKDDILGFFQSSNDQDSCGAGKRWGLLSIFTGVTVLSYMGASRFLMISEAAFFNLSLLTGDLWSVLFSVVAEKIVPPGLYFLALFFVLGGVITYEMAPHPVVETESAATGAQQLEEIYREFELGDNNAEEDYDETGMELS